MSNLQALHKFVLDRCDDDHTGLWVIVRRVREAFPNARPAEIRDMTLSILRDLLDAGLIVAGFPTRSGQFDPFTSSTEGTLLRIQTEWDQLGREPDIGDVVWFATPRLVEQCGVP